MPVSTRKAYAPLSSTPPDSRPCHHGTLTIIGARPAWACIDVGSLVKDVTLSQTPNGHREGHEMSLHLRLSTQCPCQAMHAASKHTSHLLHSDSCPTTPSTSLRSSGVVEPRVERFFTTC